MNPRTHWDIFCNVVDNYGDIGVCWRLARQLASEHQLQVRLWVDDLASFAKLAPELDPSRACQKLCGVEIRHWTSPFPDTKPADVVIEAFACELPDNYIATMAAQNAKPLWINLEYLSAEAWVGDYHGLPSPHPRLALTKYFFFPGFTPHSGGLMRETSLLAARDAFQSDAQAQAAWWQSLGVVPQPGTLNISLFAYPQAPIAPLLAAWGASPTPIQCCVPETPLSAAIAAALGIAALAPGQRIRRGNLTLIGLPFLPQPAYDRLLWACDLNFVRGEDSFVRAQWAARPLIWNIYPQLDSVHQEKLEAFLALYCRAAPETAALAELWRAWNGLRADPAAAWPGFAAALPALNRHARRWAEGLERQTDLATQLVKFSKKPL
jgi:uncharacterized repeat protein (TIGR03837 family)